MKIKVLRTREEVELGLQHLPRIPDDTIYVFAGPFLGGQFHSRNVPEPFELIFLSRELNILTVNRVIPPDGVAAVPPGTVYALEARPGVLDQFIK